MSVSPCPHYGRRAAGNLTVTGRLGKSRQFRLLSCRTCRARFSERQGTPLYRSLWAEDQVTAILEPLHEGCGVLPTRAVQAPPDTVRRSRRTAGEHARAPHDEWVAPSPETRELPREEKGSFGAGQEQNGDEGDPEDPFRGDCWDHGGVRPEYRAGRVGDPGGADGGVGPGGGVTAVKERLEGRVPARITTDAYSASEGAILEAFGTEVVPPRTGPPGRAAEAVQGGAGRSGTRPRGTRPGRRVAWWLW